MKKLLLLITILLISCGQNNKVQTEKLKEINFFDEEYNFEYKVMGNEYSYNRWEELYYKGTPFTGIIHKNHKTYSQTIHYKEGKLHGPYNQYFKDGSLQESYEFDEMKPVGTHKTYHQNGKLNTILHFENGKKEGIYEDYYDSGQLRERKIYVEGNINGPFESYYENGQLKEKGNVKEIYEEGSFFSRTVPGDGPYEVYLEDGSLKEKGVFKEGKRIISEPR